MLYSPDIDGIETPQVIELVRATLSHIDPRLVEHGARVAFLAHSLLAQSEVDSDINPHRLLVLSLLHDVGAYKTSEVDDLLLFDNEVAGGNHSAYGYCFLRWFSPLGEEADAVLYHHMPYRLHAQIHSPHLRAAAYIMFADRLDIAMQRHGEAFRLAAMLEGHEGMFAPDMPRLYEKANAQLPLVPHMLSGTYRPEAEALFAALPLSVDRALQYLFMLVYSIDFRSRYTTTHTLNTMVLARELAQYLCLPTAECRKLSLAALLHDLGKVAVPPEILEYPGRLSPEKMELMRHHVNFTRDIITGHVSEEVTRIAVRHHEKLDGSGYPYGLTADRLTLPERILAVADILSALTGQRSYKEAYDAEKTVGILKQMRQSGQLDTDVCDTAIRLYRPLMETVQQCRAPLVAMYGTVARAHKAAYTHLQQLTDCPANAAAAQ